MTEKNIAVVTILFNPPIDTANNIRSYLPFFDRVYLIDNSIKSNLDLLNILNDSKIVYHFDDNNEGISKRLNQAATLASKDGYKYLLTMDQDSCFNEKMLTDYLDCFENSLDKNTTAMYGVEQDKRLWNGGECNPLKSQILITSGSILNLEIHHKLKGFDENLFIDFVDTEYCLKSIISGYEIIKFNNIHMNHSIGVNKVFPSYKSFKKTSRSLHSPLRVYYMFRNYFYIKKLYGSLNKDIFKTLKKNLFISLKNNLIYNKQRRLVFRYILIAFLHFKKGKMRKWEK